ncbi:MAG: peptidylprolyl isomerase [Bacteroidales bacterium]|nr:peptidylprolyl isomerase [Bacteroidales bacterium]
MQRLFTPFFILFLSLQAHAQPIIVDELVAVIGDKKILFSDIEREYASMIQQGQDPYEGLRCSILEGLLTQKLMVNQAQVDSIEVTDLQVESALDQRMQHFVNQIGSEEKLEAYFNKSILEIKDDNRDAIREQLLTERMRSEIVKDLKITPSEIRAFYKKLSPDSIPYINAQVEVSQIVLYPASSEKAVLDVREKLLSLRQRIIDGENFATLAVLYSEDPGSAAKGGDIGYVYKGELDVEYTKAASALKIGQVSRIVESSFGYHIIQLLNRQGDRIHTRHILMKPKITAEEKIKTEERLDSILTLIRLDSLKFETAALYYSEDKDTRLNEGNLVNPNTGNSKFELDEFDTRDYIVINKLGVGEISQPYETMDKTGKTIYKIVKLKSRSNPHVANLKEDYSLFKQMALAAKENEIFMNWIADKIKTTYVKIEDRYKNCDFSFDEWLK